MDMGAWPVSAPDTHPEPRPRVPATSLDLDFETEFFVFGSVLSMDVPEAAMANFRVGSEAQALLWI